MDINSWLAIIAIFIAVVTLPSKDNLKILLFGKSNFKIRLGKIMIFINLVFLPFLIFFDDILLKISFLKKFTFSWGMKPKNIAFILFYISFLWIIKELFYKPKINPNKNKKIIEVFDDFLNNKSFPEFFKLFSRNTNKGEIVKNWKFYKTIIFRPQFLSNIIDYKPSYILSLWSQFITEKEFQSVFKLFLNKSDSLYYSEIKENWNYNNILDDKPFLQTVLIDNLKQSIDNGIFLILADHFNYHLNSKNKYLNIYNQDYYCPRLDDNNGYDLPMFYHIRFIELMYLTAIKNNIDISTISEKYTNMPSIFSSIIGLMIDNIILTNDNCEKEFPTNYHWLIKEIFSIQSFWLKQINQSQNIQNSNINTNYLSYIHSSIQFCLEKLYKGLEENKITNDFLNRIIYDNFTINKKHKNYKDLLNLKNIIKE